MTPNDLNSRLESLGIHIGVVLAGVAGGIVRVMRGNLYGVPPLIIACKLVLSVTTGALCSNYLTNIICDLIKIDKGADSRYPYAFLIGMFGLEVAAILFGWLLSRLPKREKKHNKMKG